MAKLTSMELEQIYNFLIDTHDVDEKKAVEIRAFVRDGEQKTVSFKFNGNRKSLEENLQGLYTNHSLVDVFYSVFTFSRGKYIKNDTSITTRIVAIDVDNCNSKIASDYKEEFVSRGIEPSYIINSGHGYHFIWILHEPTNDKEILKKFVKAMRENGFDADPKVIDSARILRLPYSTNCKDACKSPEGTVKPVTVVSSTCNTYDVNSLFEALNSSYELVEPQEQPQHKDSTPKVDYKFYDMDTLQKIYKGTRLEFENLNSIQEPIRAILMGFRPGKTDKQLGALVPYFKDLGYTYSQIIQLIKAMAKYNYFDYNGDVVNDINRKVTHLFYHDYRVVWKDIKEFGNRANNNIAESIKIDNEVLSCKYGIALSSQAFILYLRVLLHANYNHKYRFTIDELAAINKKSSRRTRDTLQELITSGIIDKKRSGRKKGEKYIYYLSKFKTVGKHGFTTLPDAMLFTILSQLDQNIITESMVRYILVTHWQCQYNSMMSQEAIASHIGVKRNTISMMWKRFDTDKRIIPYITREQEWLGGGKYTYNYYSHLGVR